MIDIEIKNLLQQYNINEIDNIINSAIRLLSIKSSSITFYKYDAMHLIDNNENIFNLLNNKLEDSVFILSIIKGSHNFEIPSDFDVWPFKSDSIRLKLDYRKYTTIAKGDYEKYIALYYNNYRNIISLLKKLKKVVENPKQQDDRYLLSLIIVEARYLKSKMMLNQMFNIND